jgi:dTDP-4-amino-4,6-dideoxygalactose transaminase
MMRCRCERNTRFAFPGGGRRDEVGEKLKAAGVPTAIYYPKSLHQQAAYRQFPAAGALAVPQRLSREVLSLPVHPYLDGAIQERIVKAIVDAT